MREEGMREGKRRDAFVIHVSVLEPDDRLRRGGLMMSEIGPFPPTFGPCFFPPPFGVKPWVRHLHVAPPHFVPADFPL